MNSKIEGLPGSTVRSANVPSAAPKAASSARDEAVTKLDDSVKLSGEAADIASLAKQLGQGPSIDVAKVAAVRTALETGTYRIDAQEIAQRLTRLERELGV